MPEIRVSCAVPSGHQQKMITGTRKASTFQRLTNQWLGDLSRYLEAGRLFSGDEDVEYLWKISEVLRQSGDQKNVGLRLLPRVDQPGAFFLAVQGGKIDGQRVIRVSFPANRLAVSIDAFRQKISEAAGKVREILQTARNGGKKLRTTSELVTAAGQVANLIGPSENYYLVLAVDALKKVSNEKLRDTIVLFGGGELTRESVYNALIDQYGSRVIDGLTADEHASRENAIANYLCQKGVIKWVSRKGCPVYRVAEQLAAVEPKATESGLAPVAEATEAPSHKEFRPLWFRDVSDRDIHDALEMEAESAPLTLKAIYRTCLEWFGRNCREAVDRDIERDIESIRRKNVAAPLIRRGIIELVAGPTKGVKSFRLLPLPPTKKIITSPARDGPGNKRIVSILKKQKKQLPYGILRSALTDVTGSGSRGLLTSADNNSALITKGVLVKRPLSRTGLQNERVLLAKELVTLGIIKRDDGVRKGNTLLYQLQLLKQLPTSPSPVAAIPSPPEIEKKAVVADRAPSLFSATVGGTPDQEKFETIRELAMEYREAMKIVESARHRKAAETWEMIQDF